MRQYDSNSIRGVQQAWKKEERVHPIFQLVGTLSVQLKWWLGSCLLCLEVVSCDRSQDQWLSRVPDDSRLAVKILTSSWAQGPED